MAQARRSRRMHVIQRGPGGRSGQALPLLHHFELLFLPGLDTIVAAEVEAILQTSVHKVPGRDDSMLLDIDGRWDQLLALRTPVAVFAVMSFPVPRPKSLLSGEYLPSIIEVIDRVCHLNRDDRPAESFRFEAAGADSPVFTRLAAQLAEATGLDHHPHEGDVVLRVRRSISVDGWDVLVRLSTRPLSHRRWRVCNFPGAVNATIAAAIARLSEPKPSDRIVNLMCGSGTLLIERLLAGPARTAIGVDIDQQALAACTDNLAAAGLSGRCHVLQADATGSDWLSLGPFDLIMADPPWGGLIGDHAGNEAIHLALLQRAREATAPGARFIVLTHEIRQMERCLRTSEHLWAVQSVTRVFQKGHHPRIYILRPA